METLAVIQVKLEQVEQEIEEAKAKLEAGKLAPDVFTALSAHLMREKKVLKDEIEKTHNPAPPGNIICISYT